MRSLQLEKEKMKELIEELKHSNKLYSSEREVLEERAKARGVQLHKFASQCQAYANKISMLDELLADYKYAMMDLGGNASLQQALQSSGSQTISHIQNSLQAKEDEMKAKHKDEVAKIVANLKVDP